jgi:hypothetical protein
MRLPAQRNFSRRNHAISAIAVQLMGSGDARVLVAGARRLAWVCRR